jgi:hypothetical protein
MILERDYQRYKDIDEKCKLDILNVYFEREKKNNYVGFLQRQEKQRQAKTISTN